MITIIFSEYFVKGTRIDPLPKFVYLLLLT